MICKYCGYSSEDETIGEYCPECGKAWDDDGYEEATEVVDLTENESEDLTETVELMDDDQVTGEETFSVEDSDYETEETNNTQPAKKNKYAGIIAACAGFVVVVCIVAVVLLSGKDKEKTEAVGSTTQGSSQVSDGEGTVEDEGVIGDYSQYTEYITTLGSYVGVEVSMVADEVTEDDVMEEINSVLLDATTMVEVTDRNTVQDGDIANIDYTGYIDGEAFSGGSAEGYNLTIGSGTFIPGFEDGLIGATVGETVNVDVTFPEDYNNTDYAGKAATFEVTVNSINEEITPELTDEWVTENTDFTSVDEYKDSIKVGLQEDAIAELENTKASRILETVLNNSVIESYPEDSVQNYVDYMTSYYEYYASMFGVTLEEFVSGYLGMTLEDFNANVQFAAEANIGLEMLCFRIAYEEGMALSDEEYETAATEFATENGYGTLEEFEADYTKSQIYDRLIMNKVMEFVSENAIEVTE